MQRQRYSREQWHGWLEQGTFQFPTDLKPKEEKPISVEITASDLSLLLGGIDLGSVHRRRHFERPRQPR